MSNISCIYQVTVADSHHFVGDVVTTTITCPFQDAHFTVTGTLTKQKYVLVARNQAINQHLIKVHGAKW